MGPSTCKLGIEGGDFVNKSDSDKAMGYNRVTRTSPRFSLWKSALNQTFTWHIQCHPRTSQQAMVPTPCNTSPNSENTEPTWRIAHRVWLHSTHTAPPSASTQQELPTQFCIRPSPGRMDQPLPLTGSWLPFLPLFGPWHPFYVAFGCLEADGQRGVNFGSYVFTMSKSSGTQPFGPALGFLQEHNQAGDEKKPSWCSGSEGPEAVWGGDAWSRLSLGKAGFIYRLFSVTY